MKSPHSLIVGAVIGLTIGAIATTVAINTARDTAPEATAGRPGGGRGGYAPAVTMIAAESAEAGRTLEVIGEGRSLKSVTLTSEATGIVSKVNIAPGEKVSKDEVLLQLDDLQQQILLDRVKAQYPIAKANAERYADLLKTESASELEAEAAFNSYKTAEADLRAAEFALQQRKIRAPFDGVIGLTEVEPGDYLRAGDMVATLDDTSSIIIEFAVPQEAAQLVEIGQPVTAQLASGGEPFEGRITAIDSRVDTDSRTLKIEATFNNEDGRMLPGAVFAVSTTSKGEPAVSVPGLAIQWDRAGPYVWKRGEDGRAQRAGVSIIQRTDNIVLVKGEVAPGDLIVWEGADRVRLGLPLPGADKPERPRGAAAGAAIGTSGGAFGGQ